MTHEENSENLNSGSIYILRNTNYSKPGENDGEEIVETIQKTVHKLPEILKKKDGIFVMKNRIEDIAIYRKIASFEGSLLYDHFEVVKIKTICIRDINSKEILYFKEIYPESEEIGFYKWIFHNKSSTNKKFNKLLEIIGIKND